MLLNSHLQENLGGRERGINHSQWFGHSSNDDSDNNDNNYEVNNYEESINDGSDNEVSGNDK